MSAVPVSVASLLVRLESMPFRAQWKEMVQLGQRSVSQDVTLQATLTCLAGSPVHYQRMLAAMAFRGVVAGSFHAQPAVSVPTDVLAACKELIFDPCTKISKLVRCPVVEVSSDAELLELLQRTPPRQYRFVCGAIAKCKRNHVLQQVYSAGTCAETKSEGEVPRALPYAHQVILAGRMSLADFENLTHDTLLNLPQDVIMSLTLRYPDSMHRKLSEVLLSFAENHDATTANVDGDCCDISPTLSNVLRYAMQAYTKCCHAKNWALGLDLMRRCLAQLSGPTHNLISAYLRILPVETCRFMVTVPAVAREMQLPFGRRLRKKMTQEHELVVALMVMEFFSVHRGYDCFPPEVRRLYYRQNREKLMDTYTGAIQLSALENLADAGDRVSEAERCYALAALQERPHERIGYLKVMPFSRARELGKEFITNPDPQLRIATIQSLVYSVRYYPSELTEVLKHIQRNKKEQDPWRLAMARSLQDLPPHVWQEEHVAVIPELIQTALDAKDTSQGTQTALYGVLVRIAERYPTQAVAQILEILACNDNAMYLHDLKRASPATVTYVLQVLVPILIKEAKRTNNRSVTLTLQSFDRKQLERCKSTLKPLLEVCMEARNIEMATFGIKWYSNLFYQDFCETVAPRLLTADASAILVNEVKEALARDIHGAMMVPFLKSIKNIQGKYVRERRNRNNDEHLYVDFGTKYAYRWPAAYQHIYAQTLSAAMEEHFKKQWWRIRQLLTVISSLPSADAEDGLLPYAAEKFEDVFTRDCVIGLLGDMKDRTSYEELLRALKDERVREATLAIIKRLRGRPAAEAIAVLYPLLATSKSINIQKEIIRFVGDLACPEALDCMRRFSELKGSDMHDDTKVALRRGYWSYLDQTEVWDLYEEAASSSRAADAIALSSIPEKLLIMPWQVERMNQLLCKLLQHPDNSVKSATLSKVNTSPRFQSPLLYNSICSLLSLGEESRLIDMGMNCLTRFNVLPAVEFARVLAAIRNDRILSRVAGVLQRSITSWDNKGQRAHLRVVANHLASTLIAERRQPSIAVALILHGTIAKWTEQLAEMQAQQLMHPGTANAAVSTLTDMTFRGRAHAVDALESGELRGHADPLLRRLGLAIVQRRAAEEGWTASLRAAVEDVYRHDADLWVRSDALLLVLPQL